MDFRRVTASVAITAVLVGSVAAPAAFAQPGNGHGRGGFRISQQFEDMGDFAWGLQDVTKMMTKGIFKGRANNLFAPGANITLQESAVAIVRLMGKEADAAKLTSSQVDTLLQSMPDQSKIASWARPAVAMLVQQGVISGTEAFSPLDNATRLDVTVLLVKALGFDAEAKAKMNVTLPFNDAQLIPANLVGYVATAVDHGLITGYADEHGKVFQPNKPVKRVEMAVMMGRADNQTDRQQHDEVKGSIKSVDATNNTFVVTTDEKQDVTVTLADDVSIFIDNQEKAIADLAAGMTVEVKLDDSGKAEFVEAKTAAPSQDQAITGSVSALVQPTASALGLITVNSQVYPVAAQAEIKVNDQAATFADLKVGDNVALTVKLGLVTKVAITRASVAITGPISALTPATATALAQVTVNSTAYGVSATAVITVNGQTAAFADLRVGDSAKLTLDSNLVSKIEVTRPTTSVSGSLSAISLPSGTVLGNLTVSGTAYAVPANAVITLNGQSATLADLKVGDTVKLTLDGGNVTKVEATRTVTTVQGSIIALTPAVAANGTTPATPASFMVSSSVNGSVVLNTYTVLSTTQILVNGSAAQFSDLQLGNSVKLTLLGSDLQKVEVTR